jgi:hypothetical protein
MQKKITNFLPPAEKFRLELESVKSQLVGWFFFYTLEATVQNGLMSYYLNLSGFTSHV